MAIDDDINHLQIKAMISKLDKLSNFYSKGSIEYESLTYASKMLNEISYMRDILPRSGE